MIEEGLRFFYMYDFDSPKFPHFFKINNKMNVKLLCKPVNISLNSIETFGHHKDDQCGMHISPKQFDVLVSKLGPILHLGQKNQLATQPISVFFAHLIELKKCCHSREKEIVRGS